MNASLRKYVTGTIAIYHVIFIAQIPTWFGIFIPFQVHLALSLAGALILLYAHFLPGSSEAEISDVEGGRISIPWYDLLLLISGLAGTGFVIFGYDRILGYAAYGRLDTVGVIFAVALVVPLFEAVRRSAGIVLPSIILFFVLVTLFQDYLPGILYGRGYPPERLLYSFYVGDAGIFGTPLSVAAEFVIVFMMLGALMHTSGASRWLMEIALATTGNLRGGPAKAAVFASALFGSFSGSPSGNAATTGVFTIPMMKDIGYKPAFAAAVEAVASAGGIILPPVMGAIAFIMAEWIGRSYTDVLIAALAPALLFFLIVFVSVHLQARKSGILPSSASQPKVRSVIKRGWHHLIPIAGLLYFLIVKSYPPGMAGVYACVLVVLCSFMSKDRQDWLTARRILTSFDEGVCRWVIIAVITAAVGIMIGALEVSGVGMKLAHFVVDLSGGNLIITLVLVGLASLILGMGLDATPAYITLGTLLVPALIQLGVSDMAAHLFVIYFGVASFFTPPTCITVFVTSGIAGSPVWRTGFEATRLGIAAFLIPFAFVLNDGLLMSGSVGHIVLAIVTAIVGSGLVAAAVQGYVFGRLGYVQRTVVFIGGLLLIGPGFIPPVIGLFLAGVAILSSAFTRSTGRNPDERTGTDESSQAGNARHRILP